MTWLQEENLEMIEKGYNFCVRFIILIVMCLILTLGFWVLFMPDFEESCGQRCAT